MGGYVVWLWLIVVGGVLFVRVIVFAVAVVHVAVVVFFLVVIVIDEVDVGVGFGWFEAEQGGESASCFFGGLFFFFGKFRFRGRRGRGFCGGGLWYYPVPALFGFGELVAGGFALLAQEVAGFFDEEVEVVVFVVLFLDGFGWRGVGGAFALWGGYGLGLSGEVLDGRQDDVVGGAAEVGHTGGDVGFLAGALWLDDDLAEVVVAAELEDGFHGVGDEAVIDFALRVQVDAALGVGRAGVGLRVEGAELDAGVADFVEDLLGEVVEADAGGGGGRAAAEVAVSGPCKADNVAVIAHQARQGQACEDGRAYEAGHQGVLDFLGSSGFEGVCGFMRCGMDEGEDDGFALGDLLPGLHECLPRAEVAVEADEILVGEVAFTEVLGQSVNPKAEGDEFLRNAEADAAFGTGHKGDVHERKAWLSGGLASAGKGCVTFVR